MRVFVLCTGRSGSMAFWRACELMTNFTAAHESRDQQVGDARFDFPDNHIEADNRLSWMLGRLHERYGQEAFYVHLLRDREATAKSFSARWKAGTGIIKAYHHGILMRALPPKNEEERMAVQRDYVDTVSANIRMFLADKPNQMTMHLETLKEDFPQFWETVGAQGNLQAALAEFDNKHNATKRSTQYKIMAYKVKLFFQRIFR